MLVCFISVISDMLKGGAGLQLVCAHGQTVNLPVLNYINENIISSENNWEDY